MTAILGVNAFHGDVSAALLDNGRLVMAVEEERFDRIKHTSGIPEAAIRSCISEWGQTASDLQHLAISRDPRAHILRKALFALRSRPEVGLLRGRAKNTAAVWSLPQRIGHVIGRRVPSVHWVEHHRAHLASAFFASGYERAAVCAIDGFGDFVSTSWGTGADRSIEISRRIFFPHSLGLLYLAITQYLGFSNYGDEYKVMGLAPYGAPDRVSQVRRLLHLDRDGGFRLDLSYFRHHNSDVTMEWRGGPPTVARVFTKKLEDLLGPARRSDEPITAHHEAIAASIQVVFEDAAIHVLNAVARDTRLGALCIAGGCAMNSVLNGKIRERTPFESVYIQPAAGDNGTALGAALHVQHQVLRQPRAFRMEHGYWGPSFSERAIETAVAERHPELSERCAEKRFQNLEDLCAWVAHRITAGEIVGWFQGKMEWGARALGNRSILGDPRRGDMRDIINTKIKFRERFRPFAPSILEEYVHDYFDGAVADPFMMQVYPVKQAKRAVLPAVTHVDGTGRLQTVSRSSNPLYHDLITAFHRRTGVPVLLNTSFNENEPIVLRPAEAIDCFLRTDMDVLVMGSLTLSKRASSESQSESA